MLVIFDKNTDTSISSIYDYRNVDIDRMQLTANDIVGFTVSLDKKELHFGCNKTTVIFNDLAALNKYMIQIIMINGYKNPSISGIYGFNTDTGTLIEYVRPDDSNVESLFYK